MRTYGIFPFLDQFRLPFPCDSRRYFSESNGICTRSTVLYAVAIACFAIAIIGCGSGVGSISDVQGHGSNDGLLLVSANNLNFGNVAINSAQMQTVTLTSTGTTPVTISSEATSGAGFSIVGGSFPITLNPAQTLTLQVQFDPATSGAANGQLTISSNSTSGNIVVGLTGTGTSATSLLTVSTVSLSFGSVTVNTTMTQSLTLTSAGTSPVTVNSASITGTGFAIVGGGSLPLTLNPTQSTTLQVQFSPMATGTANGQVTISSNSSTGSIAVVMLNGTSTPVASPQLTVNATSLSFGSVAVNTAIMRSLTLTSTGTSPVTVNSAAITGSGFAIVGESFPVTLNSAQSITLQVQFNPTAPGTISGQLIISSNSTTGGTVLVTLGGTGTAANPQLTISTASVSFGSVAVNTAITQSLTLTSTGTTAVTVNSAVIGGAGFIILGGSFPVTLNPTQILTLQLQFEPATAGAQTGQITINSNSTNGGMAVVALNGTGTAVAHEVDLSWNAPTSSLDPVAGYNIYRSTGSGTFGLINSSAALGLVYVDNTVVSGISYSYVVKSVDSGGVESVPSNQVTVTIP